MEIHNEAPEHRAHFPALADPRAPPRLPAGGRVGAADAGRPGRLPTAGGEDGGGERATRSLPIALWDSSATSGEFGPRRILRRDPRVTADWACSSLQPSPSSR